MRTTILLFFTLSFISTMSAQTVCYSYDAAGNRISKILGPCNSSSFLVGPDEQSVQAAQPHQALKPENAMAPTLEGATELAQGKLFPNPNDGRFSLVLEKTVPTGAWFELFDAKGALLNRLDANGASFDFDLTDSPAGEYYLFLRTKGSSYGQWKIIRE